MAAGNDSGAVWDKILALLPSDPCEQLEVSRKIISSAIASRASLEQEIGNLRRTIEELKEELVASWVSMEMENGVLRLSVEEKDAILEFQKEVVMSGVLLGEENRRLQESVVEKDRVIEELQREAKASFDEIVKLIEERDWMVQKAKVLAESARALSEDCAELHSIVFQSLGNHIQSPNLSIPSTSLQKQDDSLEMRTYDQSNMQESSLKVTRSPGEKLSTTLPVPQVTPSTATLNTASTGVTPAGCTALGSSQDFFQLASNSLSEEQFDAFFANVGKYYAGNQSDVETLIKAEEILGLGNMDLYLIFQESLQNKP